MKRVITLHDLPCRPQRFENESLVGFLYRLMSANGHTIAAGGHYTKIRRLYAWDLPNDREVLQDLSVFIDEPSYQADLFWSERSLLHHSNLKPRALSFPKLRANSPWHCVACMQENAFHREYWVMPMSKTCPVHGTWLRTQCGVCDALLHWSTLGTGWTCPNGHIIYDAQPMIATKPSIPRDQMVALHTHFGLEYKAPSGFERYRNDATIHEIYVAYYWVFSPGRLGNEWGFKPTADGSDIERSTLSNLKKVHECAAALTYAFIRWAYLWRIVMSPLGRHVPVPVPILKYRVRRMSARVNTNSISSLSKHDQRARSSKVIDFLYEHRVLQLKHTLVYLNDLVPWSVGRSAIHHFNRWWSAAVLDAQQCGLIRQASNATNRQKKRTRAKGLNQQKKIEISLITLLDHLFFCASMLFTAVELKRFWSCFVLPRSLPGSSRTSIHKRLAAYFMRCTLAEVEHWNAQLEADLAQRHQEFCDELN